MVPDDPIGHKRGGAVIRLEPMDEAACERRLGTSIPEFARGLPGPPPPGHAQAALAEVET